MNKPLVYEEVLQSGLYEFYMKFLCKHKPITSGSHPPMTRSEHPPRPQLTSPRVADAGARARQSFECC